MVSQTCLLVFQLIHIYGAFKYLGKSTIILVILAMGCFINCGLLASVSVHVKKSEKTVSVIVKDDS